MTMHHNAKIRVLLVRAAMAAGVALTLAGCSTSGGSGGSIGGRLLVAPGKFDNYNCEQLALRAGGTIGRRKQLEGLMRKAGDSLDGQLVSIMAYQSEYTENAGDLAEMRRTAAEKNCKPIPALQNPPATR